MDFLITIKDLQTSSLQLLSSLLKRYKYTLHSSSQSEYNHCRIISKKPHIVTMATVTPALTTTQVLFSNTESCIVPQPVTDLSMLLQQKHFQDNSTKSIGPLLPKITHAIEKAIPPPAEQPKRPTWVETHSYRRGTRTNCDNLRILSSELNMIHALKITRTLKPRRSYSPKRKDEFVWGRPSLLRNVTITQ